MDLVDRLKFFMETENIASSQFADTCRIPRPTVSQILNRRNKTISDELIGKIHDAFPQISISWLLFGEGNMVTESNIEISEPENSLFPHSAPAATAEYQRPTATIGEKTDLPNFYPNNFRAPFEPASTTNTTDPEPAKSIISEQPERTSPISFTPQARKRITNIVVFYDDSSFESFMPSAQQ